MNIQKTVRLANDKYERPKNTIQDRLTEDEINEKLENYVEVEDMTKVPIGSHIRYFVTEINKKNGQTVRKFRLGGTLTNKDNAEKYVILSNGRVSWSVQVSNAIFFKKMTLEELKEGHDEMIALYKEKIKQMKKEMASLKTENASLKSMIRKK